MTRPDGGIPGYSEDTSQEMFSKVNAVAAAVREFQLPAEMRDAWGPPHELRREEVGKPTLVVRSRERSGVVAATLSVELPSSERLDLGFPNIGGLRDSTDMAAIDNGLTPTVGATYLERAKNGISMWRQTLVLTPREAALVTSTDPIGQGEYSFMQRSWLGPIIAQANAAEGVAYGTITDYLTPGNPYIERTGYTISAPEQERRDLEPEPVAYNTIGGNVLAGIGDYLDMAATELEAYQKQQAGESAGPTAWVLVPTVRAIR